MRKLIVLIAALVVAATLVAPRSSRAWVSTGLGIGYAGPYPYAYAYPVPPIYYPPPYYYPPGVYWPGYGPDAAVRWNSYFEPRGYRPHIRGYTLPRCRS